MTESGKRKLNERPPSVIESSLNDRRSLGEENRGHSDDRRTVAHDDRRKIIDDRRPAIDDDRRGSMDESRRNTNEKRRPNSERRPIYEDEYDELPKKQNYRDDDDDYDDRSYKRPLHESNVEIVPKVRSSSPVASIFNRPRPPPKINRPVPSNEKKKYEYVPTKTEKTTTASIQTDDDFYDEYDYESEKAHVDIKHEPADVKNIHPPAPISSQRDQRPATPKHKQEKLSAHFTTDELADEDFDKKVKVTSIKPQRSTAPKVEPIQQQMPHHQHHYHQHSQRPVKMTEYYEKPKETSIKSNTKSALLNFNKDKYIPESDVADYPDEETDDQPTKDDETHQPETIPTRSEFRSNVPMKVVTEIQKPMKEHEDGLSKIPYAQPQQDLSFKTKFHHLSQSNVQTSDNSFQKPNTEPEERDVYTILPKDTMSTIREPSGFRPVIHNEQPHDLDLDLPKNRPYVRIMKRPFLPSRGGSPYLPRGLKPVGAGITTSEYTTEIYQSSLKSAAIGNVQSFERQLPITRTNPNNAYIQPQYQSQLQMHPSTILNDLRTTTQHPQIESPRSPLDEIFTSDYDVTLNDALNPTLKPLSQSHESPIGFSLNQYDRNNPFARSDVSHAPSQYRSTAIPIPIQSQQTSQTMQQQQQHQQPAIPTMPPLSQRQRQQQPQQQEQDQQQQPQQSQQSQYYDDEYEY